MASQSLYTTNPIPQELTDNDLALLMNTLNPIASKCFALGLQLGMKYHQLHRIEYDYRRCEDQLRGIVSERLKQESPLTWHDIVRALRADSVRENRLASEIENMFIHHLPPPASLAPQAYSSTDASLLTSTLQKRPHLQEAMMSYPTLPSTPSQYTSPVNYGITPLVNQFIAYVKAVYKESEIERDTEVVKWPPTPSTVYINLACISRKSVSGKSREYAEITEAMVRDGNVDVIDTTKGPIEFAEIAKGISIPSGKLTHSLQAIQQKRVILVEGAPGVGKSTFAREFCRRWERGEIAQQYQLVLLLRLRDDRISQAKSLKDLIYHPLEGVSQAVSEELILPYNIHALIILEGFDELPDHCRNTQSLFFQLIAGKLLPLATVLVTSRPWATQGIRKNYENRIHQHIEILGFTSQQITEYIEGTLPQDKVSDLKAYLEKHPQIRMGMYIPLNSAIIVTVYQESQESGCALPSTLTELYTAMVQTLLLRYLCGHPQYETDTIQTFKDLPPAVYTKFSEVCKLAYGGITGTSDHTKLIFTGLPSDFDNLGLMDSVTELYVRKGTVTSHNFLHLTFQEYFAAIHVSNLSLAEQLEHFKRHKEGRLTVVLRFLAGLNALNCLSRQHVHHFLAPPPSEDSGPYCMPVDVGVTIDLVNWMFEAQSSDVIALALGQKTVEFSIAQSMLPLDYYHVGYCIAHSQCQWVLSIVGGKQWIGKDEVRMLAAGTTTTQQPSGRVVELRVREHELSVEFLNMLFTECKSVLHLHELALRLPVPCDRITWPDLSALQVLSLGMSGEATWRLDTLLPYLSLQSLTITHKGYGKELSVAFDDCVAIAAHITSTTCLQELCFVYQSHRQTHCTAVGIGDEGLEAITAALAGNQSLPLERLKLEFKCTFTETATRGLARFISNTTTLRYLSLGKVDKVHGTIVHMVENRLETITTALAGNQSLPLETLKLELKCIFTETAAHGLAQFISNSTTLQELRMWRCTLSAHGQLALVRAINDSSSLQEKSLGEFSYTVSGADEAKDLAQLLVDYPQVGGMFMCIISITQISDAGAVALAQALHHNTTMTVLKLSENSIGDVGAVALAQALHHNSTLKMLYLSKNSISDAGAVALAHALHHNSTLKRLDLGGNDGIGEEGTHQLIQALSVNSSITRACGLVLPKSCEEYATQCEPDCGLTIMFQ